MGELGYPEFNDDAGRTLEVVKKRMGL